MNPAALQAALRGDIENALAASTPGGIERQEAEGQRTPVSSSKLPREIHGATREQLETIGFKFGADADELFVSCVLPAGWRLEATGHSMHSDLLDDKGQKRAGIFYKAAFYDQRADMSMNRRFGIDSYGDGQTSPKHSPVVVTDRGVEMERFGEYERGTREGYEAGDALRKKAEVWLVSHYPHWQDPLAYW